MTMNYTTGAGFGQGQAASTAGGGTALTNAAATVMLPFRTTEVELVPRNFSTAVVVKFTKIPWLTVLKTTDLLAAVANMTNYSNAAQDNSTGTTLVFSSLATLANLGAVYIGSREPFLGVTIDVNAANSNASVLTVKYRKSDNTWADITATDNTASGGATLAIDGTVTWSEPSDWIGCRLSDVVAGIDPSFGAVMNQTRFWTRWEVSAALDASTTCNSIIALPRTTYQEIVSGMSWQEQVIVGEGGICGISALTDAGTANLVVNAHVQQRGYFPT